MRKSKQARPPGPPPHRCEDCKEYGGLVPALDEKGRPSFTPCPRGKVVAPPAHPTVGGPTIDATQRAAGEREE